MEGKNHHQLNKKEEQIFEFEEESRIKSAKCTQRLKDNIKDNKIIVMNLQDRRIALNLKEELLQVERTKKN